MTQKKVLDNILDIADSKNVHHSKFEDGIGVSRGYISRLLKKGNDVNLTLGFVINAATYLGVSLEYLITDAHRAEVIHHKIEAAQGKIDDLTDEISNLKKELDELEI